MSAEANLLYELHLVPRWADMDALGHINNATYFTYCEQARISWFDEIGKGASLAGGTPEGPVVVNAHCTFLKAVVYPARLIVRISGGIPGRSSFETYYEIRDADDTDILYTTGSSKVVWVNHREGRSAPLPPEIRELLPPPGE